MEEGAETPSIYYTTHANEMIKNRDRSKPKVKTGDPIDDISTSELENAYDSE